MFTGIITDIGILDHVEDDPEGRRLRIVTAYEPEGIALGASIMCEGICLTVTAKGGEKHRRWFDVYAAKETLAVTAIGSWREGRRINLERSLAVGAELGGHIVTGHIDGLATIVERTEIDDQITFVLEAPADLARFIARKGSVALNGTSLTVNSAEGSRFSVHLIPHTLSATNWPDYQRGDSVNLEVDIMARYAARLLDSQSHGTHTMTTDTSAEGTNILVVEARFYNDLADAQLAGAKAALEAAGARVDVVTVPGALEIPAAIAFAIEAGRNGTDADYHGYVALGCVIRGETTHYEIVSSESARALMDLAVHQRVAIGNGILTVENETQAWRRARAGELDKGGDAARAALAMIALKRKSGAGK